MKTILYYLIKVYIKTGLYFYSKKIKVSGSENVPKKGAILFLGNHPNGLIDPLFIATTTKRKTYFLVRAAVFKNKIAAFLFDLLGMMPIYRIRDGIKELSKNEAIFNKCYNILGKEKTLLIFPEGSHNRKRTIRPLSKGFTRIVFGTLEKYPDLKINLVPIGITYQNSSKHPTKVAINYGQPIIANDFYDKNDLPKSINKLKEQVKTQLEELSVHIPENNYEIIKNGLNEANIDFTEVKTVNELIQNQEIPKKQERKKENKYLFSLIIINSIIPYLIWKKLSKKITEIEFIDTFRFGLNIVLFPLFYLFQAYLVYKLSNITYAISYLVISILLLLIYSKTSPTNSE